MNTKKINRGLNRALSLTIIGFFAVTSISYQSASAQESISVSTDKTLYNYENTVTISGNVSPVIQNQTVRLQITYPNGQIGTSGNINPNSHGSYSATVHITNQNLLPGTYIVTTTYAGTQSQTTFSYVGFPSQSTLSLLEKEIQNLQSQLQQDQDIMNGLESVYNIQQALNNAQEKIQQIQDSKPTTIISNDTVNWHFSDSKGNAYDWTLPMSAYDGYVKYNAIENIPTYNLQLPNGQTVTTYDYSKFTKFLSERKEFSSVVDTLYNNAGSDDQFIYEVWHLVAEMTTYNKDITNNNLWPYEVLTRGEGDCKDKSILIADLLRSSSHTSNWDIHLVIMDSDNPANPQKINHMIVSVNTGQQAYLIEATATPDNNGLNAWAGTKVTGWNVPF